MWFPNGYTFELPMNLKNSRLPGPTLGATETEGLGCGSGVRLCGAPRGSVGTGSVPRNRSCAGLLASSVKPRSGSCSLSGQRGQGEGCQRDTGGDSGERHCRVFLASPWNFDGLGTIVKSHDYSDKYAHTTVKVNSPGTTGEQVCRQVD